MIAPISVAAGLRKHAGFVVGLLVLNPRNRPVTRELVLASILLDASLSLLWSVLR